MNDISITERARRRRQSQASKPALPEPDLPKLAYSIDEFVRASGLKRTFVYGEIKAGRLKAKKAGSRTTITHPDGVEYFEALPDVELSGEAA